MIKIIEAYLSTFDQKKSIRVLSCANAEKILKTGSCPTLARVIIKKIKIFIFIPFQLKDFYYLEQA